MPECVSTVDKYQGQQNDYILLSLVRTESVGHMRDIRRLVVAASRARLGLYVFCRERIFAECPELSRTFELLRKRPNQLQIVTGEGWPCQRLVDDSQATDKLHTITDVKAMGILVYQMVQQAQNLSSSSLTPLSGHDGGGQVSSQITDTQSNPHDDIINGEEGVVSMTVQDDGNVVNNADESKLAS